MNTNLTQKLLAAPNDAPSEGLKKLGELEIFQQYVKKTQNEPLIEEFKNDVYGKIYKELWSFNSEGDILCSSWCPNSSKLAVGTRNGVVVIVDADSGETTTIKKEENFEGIKKIWGIKWSPDGNRILFPNYEGMINILDLESNLIKKIEGNETIYGADWSPDGRKFVCAHDSGKISIRDIQDDKFHIKNTVHEGSGWCVAWSPDGVRIASGGQYDFTVRVLNSETGKQLIKLKAHTSCVYCLKWAKDSTNFWSTGADSTLKCWDAKSGENLRTLVSNGEEIWSLDLSPDEKFVMCAGENKTVDIWDLSLGIEVFSKACHQKTVTSVGWCSDGRRICSTSYDLSFKVHEFNTLGSSYLRSVKIQNKVKEFNNNIFAVSWHPDEKLVALGAKCGEIDIWNTQTNEWYPLMEKSVYEPIWDINWNPEGTLLLSCSSKGEIIIWDVKNKLQLFSIQMKEKIHRARWNKICTKIATAGESGKIKILDFISGKWVQVKEIEAHNKDCKGISWNNEGDKLLSCSLDSTVKVWNATDGNKILEITEHYGEVWNAWWSPDNYYIISAGKDKLIRIFNAENGTQINSIKAHTGPVYHLAWLDNGNRILSASESDSTFRIWDFKTGVQLKYISRSPFYCIAESNSHGQIVFSGGTDQSAALYDYLDIWGIYEIHKIFRILFFNLPNMNEIPESFQEFMQAAVDFKFLDNISVFHILFEKRMVKELKLILDFCLERKIFPKQFYDNKKKPLLNLLLGSNIFPLLIDLFMRYVIAANVDIGSCFFVTNKNLFDLMKINSLTVCKFVENRFQTLREKYADIEWQDDSVECSTSTVSSFDRLTEKDFMQPEDKFQGIQVKPFNPSSTELSVFKISDIPIGAFSPEVLNEITESSAFDDFCKKQVMICYLDLMWPQARNHFLKGTLIYLFFLILLVINSLFILPQYIIDKEGMKGENNYWLAFLIFSILLALFIGKMFVREFGEWNDNKSGYFSSIWNYIDTTNILMNGICIILNFLAIYDVMESLEVIRLFNSICFFLALIRIFDFFRAFKQTCFLIEIILQVLRDMKTFLFLMILLLANFSCSGKFFFLRKILLVIFSLYPPNRLQQRNRHHIYQFL